MGPRRAADRFLSRHDGAAAYRVTLYGSLPATGNPPANERAYLLPVAGHPANGARVPGVVTEPLDDPATLR